jgi:hypothetical protein
MASRNSTDCMESRDGTTCSDLTGIVIANVSTMITPESCLAVRTQEAEDECADVISILTAFAGAGKRSVVGDRGTRSAI